MTLEQKRAVAIARARQAQAQAQGQPSGADAMRARGLTSPDPSAANAAADPRTGMQKAEGFGRQLIEGAGQGLAGLAGIPGSIVNLEADLLGSDFRLPTGQQGMQEAARAVTGDTHPINSTERRARAVGEYAAPSVATGAMGGIPGMLASGASGTASGLAAGEVRERGGGAGMEAIAALLAGGVPLAVGGMASKAKQTKDAIKAVPDMDVLQGQADNLYDAGRATGMTAPGALTQGLEAKLTDIATKGGIISPSGALAPKYESISHALRMAKDYAGVDMNPEQMQQVRKALQAAAQSADGTEARIGTQMLKEFDKGIRNPLVPEFADADAIQSRVFRGQEIKEAIDIATQGRRTPNVTALGNEFQNLTRKGIRGDLTYPPELKDAIAKAANGSGGRQIAEGLGRAAPTSIVGGGIGFGVPASMGTAMFGPVGGAAAGSAASGAGLLARLLANRMARGDAREALATALNGAALPDAQTPEAVKAAIAALLASTAAQGPR